MRLSLRFIFQSILVAWLMLSGCAEPPAPAQLPAPTLAPVIPSPSPQIKVLEPTPIPTIPPSPTPVVVPTQKPVMECRPTSAHAPLAAVPYDSIAQAVLDALNDGYSASDLDTSLNAMGVANQPRAVASGDLTGDGLADVTVSIFDPDSMLMPPGGELLVYACQDARYVLVDTYRSPDNQGAPRILFQQDLNADSKQEVVAALGNCGVSTCFDDVKILSWNGTSLENLLHGSSQDLPYPVVTLNENPPGSGVYDLVVQGGEIGSVGAGAQRTTVRTWTYNGNAGGWEVASDVLQPSNYRIHALQDAVAANRQGDVTRALALYQRIYWDNPPLNDYIDPVVEKANLAGFAGYQLVAIYAGQGETEKVKSTIELLSQRFPTGTAQHVYVEMAQVYLDALSQGEVGSACRAAQAYASEHAAQVLDPLGPQTFGYANRAFEPADVCP